MKVLILPDATTVQDYAAHFIASYIRKTAEPVLGLATGRTMEQVYARLTARYLDGDISFQNCHSFNLDEYVGLNGEDPQSYRFYMNNHLFKHIDIDVQKTHVPDGSEHAHQTGTTLYEAAIRAAGGIGLQLLGIGSSGHIGFNEPLSSFSSRTRVVTLDPSTRDQNAEMFDGDLERVPKRAVTMGVGTILEARQIVLVATGSAKASIIAAAIEGPVSPMISASALHFHNDCIVVLDEAAASELVHADIYKNRASHDPELSDWVAND